MKHTTADLDDIQIDPNFENSRGAIGDISELKASVQELGLLHPLGVRHTNGSLLLRTGFRRFQILKELEAEGNGIGEIPVVILEDNNEERDWFIHLAENLHSKGLPLPQQVRIVKHLMEMPNADADSVATQLNRSTTWVWRLYRLSLNLIPEILLALENDYITEAQARSLSRFSKADQLENLKGLLDPDVRDEYLGKLKKESFKPGTRAIRKQLQSVEKYHTGKEKGQTVEPEYDVDYRKGVMAALKWALGTTSNLEVLRHPEDEE